MTGVIFEPTTLRGRPKDTIEQIPVGQHADSWKILHAGDLSPATDEELPLTRSTKYREIVENEPWVLERPDRSHVVVECNSGPIQDAEGRITGGVIAWRDISRRLQIERALRQSEARLRAMNRRAGNPVHGHADGCTDFAARGSLTTAAELWRRLWIGGGLIFSILTIGNEQSPTGNALSEPAASMT